VTLAEIIVTVTGVIAIVAINWWFLFSKSEK
jgi:plastocyanin domain-containing protein